MKINKLRASFGNLNGNTIEFHEGLNVIYAPNESGKSTWCAFIRAMLYGIDSSDRPKAGYIPDRQRFAPWSGAPMEGTMELTADRCEITITRRTTVKNAPMRDFSATYTGTATPVEGMTGTNAGEMLTGVSKEVFKRSAFVEQGASAVTGSPELEKRIQSILSTGEENTSYSEANDTLRMWQRKRRYNHRGLLPDIEAGIDEKKRTIAAVEEISSGIASMRDELEQLENECSQLELDVKDARKRQRDEIIKNLSEARENVRNLSREQDIALVEANRLRKAVQTSAFESRALADVESEAEDDLEKLEELERNADIKNSPAMMIIVLAAALVCALMYEYFQKIVFIIAAAVFCAGAVFLLTVFSKKRKKAGEINASIDSILARYGVSDKESITAKLDEYHAFSVSLKKAEARERETRDSYEAALEKLDEIENSALGEFDFASGNSEPAVLGKVLAEKRDKVVELSTQIGTETGRLMTLGDPIVLGAELINMEEARRTIQSEYDAISMALDALKDADDEIQSRFSPELGRVAAEYMSEVTGGKYEEILLDKDFSARTRARNDSVAHESEYLSAGTYDLLYLAVRLAVCELALPDGETCPLIIDDALVNLDEERYGQAMRLLREISKDRQVILFTCRK